MLNAQSIKNIFPEVEKSRFGDTSTKNFPSKLKKEIAKYSIAKSIDEAMKKYGVSRTSVYTWRRDYG
jgi:transposase-like protein